MTAPSTTEARLKTLAVLTLVVVLVLEIVDLTIVNTALPAIQSGIGATTAQSQWIVAGYSLAFAPRSHFAFPILSSLTRQQGNPFRHDPPFRRPLHHPVQRRGF